MIAANNRFLMKTNPQLTRALADGGSSLNHPEIQRLARQQVDLGLWGNLKLWVHRDLVKTRTSGSDLFVPKAYDMSGNNNDAAQTTEANQPKLISTGMEFNGSNDYLNCGDDASLRITNNLTMLFWVKWADDYLITISNSLVLIGRYDINSKRNYAIVLEPVASSRPDGSLTWFLSSNGTSAEKNYKLGWNDSEPKTDPPADDTYHHIGFTFASNVLKPYLNGVDKSSNVYKYFDSTVNSLHSNDSEVLIAALENDGSILRTTQIIINDVRTFDKVLSSTEISAIYNLTKSYYGL